MRTKLFVEGGDSRGNSKSVSVSCRAAFTRFLENAGLKGRLPRVVACGSRDQAVRDFSSATDPGRVLLVDAECPVHVDDPWVHPKAAGLSRPSGATEVQCHLMVECTESWLLADRKTLGTCFGKHFNEGKLPGIEEAIESVPKDDVHEGLKAASLRCARRFVKGEMTFELLGKVDPKKVESASPWAKRFLDHLRLTL